MSSKKRRPTLNTTSIETTSHDNTDNNNNITPSSPIKQSTIVPSPSKKQTITPSRATRASPSPTKNTPIPTTSTSTTRTTPSSMPSSRRQSRARPPVTSHVIPTSREMNFFGVSPPAIMEDIVECVEDHVADGLDELEKQITAYPTLKSYRTEVAMALDDLQTTMGRHLDKRLQTLKEYSLRNIFVIPNHVILPSEQSQPATPASEAEDTEADAKIHQLQQQIITLRHLNPKLRREIAGLDHDLGVYEASTTHHPFDPEDTETILSRLRNIGAEFEELNTSHQQLVSLVAENHLNIESPDNKASHYRADLSRAPLSADQMSSLSASLT